MRPTLISSWRKTPSPSQLPSGSRKPTGAGVEPNDTTIGGNDGTLAGAPTWTTRDGSPALLLDGDSDYVRIPDADTLDVTDAVTIAAWIRPERTGTQYVVKKAMSSSDGFELSLSSSGSMFVRFNRDSSNNTYRVDSNSDYPTNGDWVHPAATFDGTTTRLYVNGVQEATGAGPPTGIAATTHDLVLGAQSNGYRPFQGGLDDVHLYDHALTPQQITKLATS